LFRQQLFHKLVSRSEGEESAYVIPNNVVYALRPKDLVDLIGCTYLAFKNSGFTSEKQVLNSCEENYFGHCYVAKELKRGGKGKIGDTMTLFPKKQLSFSNQSTMK